ncbi:MAG: hypothetical protein ACI4QR_00590 [Eubacteriales bacterium]
MGFGIMFLGSLFLEGVVSFPDIIGFIILFIGLKTAAKYCRSFDNALKMCIVGMVFSGVKLFYTVLSMKNIDIFGNIGGLVFGALYAAFLSAFYIVLFRGIADIADDTGLPNIKRMAFADVLLVPLFITVSEVITLMISLASEKLGDFASKAAGTAMLLSLLATLLSAILIFNCYMRICLEGDEDMEGKKSRFKSPFDFVDKKKDASGKKGGGK